MDNQDVLMKLSEKIGEENDPKIKRRLEEIRKILELMPDVNIAEEIPALIRYLDGETSRLDGELKTAESELENCIKKHKDSITKNAAQSIKKRRRFWNIFSPILIVVSIAAIVLFFIFGDDGLGGWGGKIFSGLGFVVGLIDLIAGNINYTKQTSELETAADNAYKDYKTFTKIAIKNVKIKYDNSVVIKNGSPGWVALVAIVAFLVLWGTVVTIFAFLPNIIKSAGGTTTSSATESATSSATEPATEFITVIFDANGGKYDDGRLTNSEDIELNSVLKEPSVTPIKSGFERSGWSISQDNSSDLWDFSTRITSDIITENRTLTLYAVWVMPDLQITIDGSEYSPDYKKEYEGNYFLWVSNDTPSLFNLSQIVHLGEDWKVYDNTLNEISLKMVPLTDGDNVVYIKTLDRDLTYILYIHKSYAINISYYDGEEKLKTEEVFTGEITQIDYQPNIEGYTFNAWADGFGAEVRELRPFTECSLYAVKTANTYSVSFNSNGGEPLSEDYQVVTYDGTYSLPVPTRTGYSFGGWFIGSDQLTDNKGNSVSTWNYPENQTLTASWQANKYRLTLVSEDTEEGSVSGSGNYDYDSTVTLHAIANDGYNFVGWYDEYGGLVSNSADCTVTKGLDETYTARWNFFTVTVNHIPDNAGVHSEVTDKKVSVGKTIELNAQSYLGYQFAGWFNGELLLSREEEFEYEMIAENVTITAHWQVKDEMSSFNFQSTMTDCEIVAVETPELKEVILPEYVTGIGESAFQGCENISTIIIPKNVESIKSSAFSGCIGLEEVIFTESGKLISIGSNAFSGCRSLTEIKIPDSVEAIGGYAFQNCNSLASIRLPFVGAAKDGTTNTHFGYIFGAYSYSSNNSYVPQSLKSVEITSGGTIASSAFRYCSSLTSITIPDSVSSIGNYAFYNCLYLTEINFNATACNDLSSGNFVFYNAGQSGEGIKVTVGANVTKIPAYLFFPYGYSSFSAPKITSVEFAEGSVCESIGNYAFYNCSSLTGVYITDIAAWCGISFGNGSSNPLTYAKNLYLNGELITDLVIPDSVTAIGDYAFQNCSSLTSITIPEGVTTIGERAFSGCSSLTSITIPEGVTTIGSYAFYNCLYLTEINFNATACNDLSDKNYVFSNAGQSGEGIKVTVGANVTKIPAYLFCPYDSTSYVPKITSVEFAKGSVCESIGSYAFYECSSLESITIPESVTAIGSRAFSGCYKLVEVYNLSSLKITAGSSSNGYVGYYAKAVYTSTATKSKLTTTDDGYIFYDDTENGKGYYLMGYTGTESEIILPDKYNGNDYSIYQYAFYNCSSLTNVTIGNDVTTIGEYAFSGCSSLTSITIPKGVTTIGERAFRGCSSLESITIPESVTAIGDYAFYECSSLTSITIPDSVTTIGSSAFESCSSLESITVKEGNPVYHSAGDCLIETASKILIVGCKNSIIPHDGSVTTIGWGAFEKCSSLTSITIPDSVTTIGSYAFYNCSSLTSITIPDSVTTIGNCAFEYCSSLTSITIPDSVTSIGSWAFERCSGLTSITIPDSVISIGWGAFEYCSSLTSITIPNSVTTIGMFAFSGCSSLTEVYYKGTAEEWDSITIENYNTSLTNATRYYYSETQPTTEGNYWHYVDGEPVVWTKEE